MIFQDIPIGIGKMFNINLPQNFDCPYQATSIENFWRKWHISLSRFLKDYLYKPICKRFTYLGNKISYIAVMVVFFVSGLWHGASWMFVIWGVSHGIINVINKFMRVHNININEKISWFMTFVYLNLTWVFFRSENMNVAKNMFKSAFGFNGFAIPKIDHNVIYFVDKSHSGELLSLIVLPILILFIFFPVFKMLSDKFKPTKLYLLVTLFMFLTCIFIMSSPNNVSPFIYFNF